MQVVDLDFILY